MRVKLQPAEVEGACDHAAGVGEFHRKGGFREAGCARCRETPPVHCEFLPGQRP